MKENKWTVLVVVGILCLLVASVLAIARLTAAHSGAPGNASNSESLDVQKVYNDSGKFELPEI